MDERPWRVRIRTHSAWQHILAEVGGLTRGWGGRTIVVLSSYRFGSSLMMNYLNAVPNVRRLGEILNPCEIVYGNFKEASQDRVITHIKAMCFALPRRITMVKLMDTQIENHGLTLDHIISALDRPYVVAVYRRDLLSAYVSWRIALQNGIWYSIDRVNDVKICIELPALKNYLLATRHRWIHNSAKLRAYDRSIIAAYEEFSVHPEPAIYKIFDSIGFCHRVPIATDSVRQNPAPLKCKIGNYDQLRLDELIARGEATLHLDLM
jgi:hypothetical protein